LLTFHVTYALQAFFKEEHSKGRSYADLYELVQHAGNVLPRL
jgi:vacuolar protein sorting-associated protein 35